MNRTEYVREVFLNDPRLIPSIMKDKSFNNKITKGILFKMLPFRSSIEIEANGDLTLKNRLEIYSLTKNKPDIDPFMYNRVKEWEAYNKVISKKVKEHNIFSLDQDCFMRIREKDDSGLSNFVYPGISKDLLEKEVKRYINEFKISILNYTQATGLYTILEELKREAYLNTDSGIHFHIDLGTPDFAEKLRDILYSYGVNPKISQVNEFFDRIYKKKIEPLLGEYTGDHNPKMVAVSDKSVKINFNVNYGTVEYRTGKMSFDYNTIMKQMVGLNQITKEIKKFVFSL